MCIALTICILAIPAVQASDSPQDLRSEKRPKQKNALVFLVRLTGLEPAHRETLDPKSNASTNFATGAAFFSFLRNRFSNSAAKVQISEQNTKQKEKFFHFCLYFRAKVPSSDRPNGALF